MAVFSYLNPFSKYFLQGKHEKSRRNDIMTALNAQGASEDDQLYDFDSKISLPDESPEGSCYVAPIHFSQIFQSKKSRIIKYREMEQYPEIGEALDIICDDAIVEDSNGKIVQLNFHKDIPPAMERIIRLEFEYILNDVIRARERLWELFRKFLVEGELFVEIVINNDKNSVIGIKPLATYNTFPVYRGNVITNFIQGGEGAIANQVDVNIALNNQEDIIFPAQQVSYVNWGQFGVSRQDVRGFLERTIRTYNQLKNLEDAIVVYRLVRAPERRVWNIEVGRMPKGKAEEYIGKMISKYKKQLNYNPETGAIDSAQNVQAMTEDFWFAKQEGQGSEVQPLPSGANLGELDDLKYFLKKLYTSLKLPRNRLDNQDNQYTSGKAMEREEVKFGRFISRCQSKFKSFIMDVFIEHLRIKGSYDEYIDRSIYDIQFNQSNDFKEYKELELLQARIETWNSINDHIVGPEKPDEAFSREFAFKYLVRWSDEMWDKNQELIMKEKSGFKKEGEEEDTGEELPPEEGLPPEEESGQERPKLPPEEKPEGKKEKPL